MTPEHIIYFYGVERFDLDYYNCIFDEVVGEYNTNKPHQHKVRRAWNVKNHGYIWAGIAYKSDGSKVVFGCREENFTYKITEEK